MDMKRSLPKNVVGLVLLTQVIQNPASLPVVPILSVLFTVLCHWLYYCSYHKLLDEISSAIIMDPKEVLINFPYWPH